MDMRTITTKTPVQTKKIASLLAKSALHISGPRPLVIGLVGNLGAGKTAFAQGFAKGCGIKEKVRSPTFVLIKTYRIGKNNISRKTQFTPAPEWYSRKTMDEWSVSRKVLHQSHGRTPVVWGFTRLVHIDCYRLNSPQDLISLGFSELIKDKNTIILIEWADRIKKILPKDTVWIRLAHGQKINERTISIDLSTIAKTRNVNGLWLIK